MICLSPKEKAILLFNSFYGIPLYVLIVKECCYKAIDEIIESRKDDPGFDDSLFMQNEYHTPHPMYLSYWIKVREEIKNLQGGN
jgi:hypothetical protein